METFSGGSEDSPDLGLEGEGVLFETRTKGVPRRVFPMGQNIRGLGC